MSLETDCGRYTLSDHVKGIEVNLGPSEIKPGSVTVTIFACDEFEVQRIIDDLAIEYNNVKFTQPTRCADHRWGSIGRVW